MSEPRTGFCRGVVLLGGVLAGSACAPPSHDVVSQGSRGRIRGPAEHGRRASLDPADHLAQRRVRVEPFPPGGSLRRPPRRHDHRLVIHPPWEPPAARGYVVLDLPLALEIDGTLLFRSDRSPGPSAWKVYPEPDGATRED